MPVRLSEWPMKRVPPGARMEWKRAMSSWRVGRSK